MDKELEDIKLVRKYFYRALEDHNYDFTRALFWALNHFNQYRYQPQREAFKRLSSLEKNRIMAEAAAIALGKMKSGAQ